MHNQNFGGSVINNEFHFWWSKTPVDVDRYCIDECTTVEHLEVFDAVLIEECNSVLHANASCLQCVGHSDGTFIQFAPCARAFTFNQRVIGSTRNSVGTNDVSKGGYVFSHAKNVVARRGSVYSGHGWQRGVAVVPEWADEFHCFSC